jgi:hypothetical protein
MNIEQEQLAEMTHRLASLTLTPFRLGCHREVPIRLVLSKSVLPKNLAEDLNSPNRHPSAS